MLDRMDNLKQQLKNYFYKEMTERQNYMAAVQGICEENSTLKSLLKKINESSKQDEKIDGLLKSKEFETLNNEVGKSIQ